MKTNYKLAITSTLIGLACVLGTLEAQAQQMDSETVAPLASYQVNYSKETKALVSGIGGSLIGLELWWFLASRQKSGKKTDSVALAAEGFETNASDSNEERGALVPTLRAEAQGTIQALSELNYHIDLLNLMPTIRDVPRARFTPSF